jgi:hypothetical protein
VHQENDISPLHALQCIETEQVDKFDRKTLKNRHHFGGVLSIAHSPFLELLSLTAAFFAALANAEHSISTCNHVNMELPVQAITALRPPIVRDNSTQKPLQSEDPHSFSI